MKKTLLALYIFIAAVMTGCVSDGEYELEQLNSEELTIFSIYDNTLIMNEEINSKTPRQLREIFAKYPNIDTIFMGVVPGSLDDDANLEAAIMVAEQGVTTVLGRYSFIASGGTDFFLAGQERIIEKGAQVGVHSWGDGGDITATDFPRGHEYHQPYIDYYQQVGWSKRQAEAFYYYTIESAPVDNLHIMEEHELHRYNITTEDIAQPEVVYRELEEFRKKNGYPYISSADARAEGIEVRSVNDEELPYLTIFLNDTEAQYQLQ